MSNKSAKSVFLAVETSGRTGSVAIGTGEKAQSEVVFSGAMRHSVELFPSIQQLLTDNGFTAKDIAEVYISVGPGSFTGLRIGVSFAKMLSLATGAKIVAVSSMDAIAPNADNLIRDKGIELKRIATVIDAKRRQFYMANYKYTPDGWEKTLADCMIKAEDFVEKYANPGDPIWVMGEGLVYYKDKFDIDGVEVADSEYWAASAKNTYLAGRKMAEAGEFTSAEELIPSYIRRPEAVVNWEKRQATS